MLQTSRLTCGVKCLDAESSLPAQLNQFFCHCLERPTTHRWSQQCTCKSTCSCPVSRNLGCVASPSTNMAHFCLYLLKKIDNQRRRQSQREPQAKKGPGFVSADCGCAPMQVAAGVAPNVHTFTSLISACGFKRQLQTCNQLVSLLQACAQDSISQCKCIALSAVTVYPPCNACQHSVTDVNACKDKA